MGKISVIDKMRIQSL